MESRARVRGAARERARPAGARRIRPHGRLRAGFSLNRLISFEPTFGLDLENVLDDDEPSNARVGLSSSLLIHTSSNADRALPVLAIGGNANYFDIEDASDFQFGVHGFAGVKLPVGSDMAVRLTAGGGRSFETDELEAYWSVFATAGLSWWPGANGRVAVASR